MEGLKRVIIFVFLRQLFMVIEITGLKYLFLPAFPGAENASRNEFRFLMVDRN